MNKEYVVYIIESHKLFNEDYSYPTSHGYILRETGIQGISEDECLKKAENDRQTQYADFVILPVYSKKRF